MRPYLALAAAAVLILGTPQTIAAKDKGLRNAEAQTATKQTKKQKKRQRVYITAPARPAYGFRNDPSFDPYGRPWRPNFYAPCYEDLGYGRFRDCADF